MAGNAPPLSDPLAQNETFALMLAELDGRIDEIERRTDKLIARYR